MVCQNCGKETNNPRFCSRSCASSYNNRLHPRKVAKVKYCKHCGVKITGRRTVCDNCNRNSRDWSRRTLGELQSIRRYQVSSRIRAIARGTYLKSSLPKICQRRGYDKHIEICHIHPIESFPATATISEINAFNNLLALCPNCHWEFDNHFFSL